MNNYELRLREADRNLRERNDIGHSEAVDILASICKEADCEVEYLKATQDLNNSRVFSKGIFVGFVFTIIANFAVEMFL